MAANLPKWPPNRGLISKIRPSDGCKGNTVPSTVVRGDDLRKPGGHLGNVGELRLLSRVAKVIAITGGGALRSKGRLDLATKTGADRVLTKPFSDEELMSCVNECLSG